MPTLKKGPMQVPSAVSQVQLMQNIESFGNLHTQATHNNLNNPSQDSRNENSPYLPVQSRHFSMTSPLYVGKADSEMANKHNSHN